MKHLGYLVLLLMLFSCSKESKQNIQSQFKKSNTSYTIDDIIILPTNFEKNYSIAKKEDLSYNDKKSGQNISRKQIRILVPTGLSKEELSNNLKSATKGIYSEFKPDGISILAYEKDDNILSAYTVAKADFAPFGMWDKISSNNNLRNYKLQINYRDSYFQPKLTTYSKGSQVKLFRKKKWDRKKRSFVPATNVGLSKSKTSWSKENIIVYVPNNTSAKIIDIHKEKLNDGSEIIMYKVLVSSKGKNYKGWVDSDNAK